MRPGLLWGFVIFIALLRLISLSAYPLMDTTEARYGEMARIMAETGNWLFPQIDYGVPFWGKPPLSFWASATSILKFENSEFFLRLPHFVASILVVVLVWNLALAMKHTRGQAVIAVAILASTFGFLVASGAVMTDMFLCLSLTLTMLGFWRGWHGERRYVYLMYLGLGIGLLAKGPIVIALAGLALLPWIVAIHGLRRGLHEFYRRMNVFSGTTLMLLVAAPWYLAMEQANPGFLQYFIVGEHFQRFVDSGWRGDMYGSGHAQIRGTIWAFWLVYTLPWSLVLLAAGYRWLTARASRPERFPDVLFLVLWMCSPMILFTLAGNILPAYVLPGVPAMGLLIVEVCREEQIRSGRYLLLIGPALLLALSAYLFYYGDGKFSDRGLLSNGIDSPEHLYYFHERPYSAQYYSGGRARLVDSLPGDERFYLAVETDKKPEEVDDLCELRSGNEKRQLYFCVRPGTS